MLEAPVRPEFVGKVGKTKRKKKIGLMFHNITKHGDIGADVRTMYVPDPGEVFGSADLSQAEARIVALLANDKELLKLFDTVDIHSLTASWLFGLKIEKVDKKGPLRQVAKSVRHAGNYGMGKRTLVELLAANSQKYGIDLTMSEWRAGQLLIKFHEYTPRIQSVFHVAVIDCLKNNDRVLVNAFGRPRRFHDRWGDELFREAWADIPQSTVPEQLKMAALRIKDREPQIKFVNEAHDALDWACKMEDFDRIARVVKEEMEKPIDFSKCSIPRGILVIPAEVQIATKNYKDFVKYQFAA
jgi:DNA polymerase-1